MARRLLIPLPQNSGPEDGRLASTHRFRMDEKALSGPVDVSENAQEEPGLLEALAPMALHARHGRMLVVTIVLGLIMQPFYESNNLQAFGSDGAEQARYIGLELLFLFLFTGLILLLARYKLDWVIKYGLMFVLWLALTYTTVPYMHLQTVDAPDPFTTEDTEIIEPVMLGAEPHGPDRIASWSMVWNARGDRPRHHDPSCDDDERDGCRMERLLQPRQSLHR